MGQEGQDHFLDGRDLLPLLRVLEPDPEFVRCDPCVEVENAAGNGGGAESW